MMTRKWPVNGIGLCAFFAGWMGACSSVGSRQAADAVVTIAPSSNPFVGARLWPDPNSAAAGYARRIRDEQPDAARALESMANQPTALWAGGWVGEIETWVRRQAQKLGRKKYLPVFVAYNIPFRDCGQYSKGGSDTAEAYRQWIAGFARGLGSTPSVVILEPDAIAHIGTCLDEAGLQERYGLIRDAVTTFARLGNVSVYIDAGHSRWVPADEMIERLKRAGIASATGFALNVSNYRATDELVAYGKALSAGVGGKPFVVDTSRNGNGPPDAATDGEASWCNPRGRAVGHVPGSDTGEPLVHAFLWIKRPGESDGTCNGGPEAGTFWPEIAVELATGLAPGLAP
jgi:endoglucanase